MSITLSVETYCNEALPHKLARRFDQLGGAIGRAAGNDLVLEDSTKYISRVHARIECHDGGYYLLDVGSNASFVNDRPLSPGKLLRLEGGDRLIIGQYLLLVSFDADPPAIAPLPPSPLQAAPPAAPAPLAGSDDSLAGASILDIGASAGNARFDPLGLDLFAAPPQPSSVPAFRGAESDHISPEIQPFPMPSAMAIPDDYNPLDDRLPPAIAAAPAPVQAAPALAPAPAPADDSRLMQALMRGLGLPKFDAGRSAEETAELVGAMLREATSGTMSVLMARAMTKRESRLDMTMIGSQANNPLKFFPDADSALSQMLNSGMAGYMPPVRAFGNAFDDLKAHELAMMAGMRAALNGVLRRFDPAAIEERLQVPTVMDKMLSANRKAKMWDRLLELYKEISQEADDDFQHLFGETFADAYEDQVQRLRPARR